MFIPEFAPGDIIAPLLRSPAPVIELLIIFFLILIAKA